MDDNIFKKYEDFILLIEKDNLNSINYSRIYGFIADQECLYLNSTIPDNFSKESLNTVDQCCIYLECDEKNIIVSTDRMGYATLYLYKNEEDWIICNSLGYLSYYVKKKNKKLSINNNFAAQYLTGGCTPFTYNETFFNEIELIPKYFKIRINKSDKKYYLDKLKVTPPVSIFSEEGLYYLDLWANKWIGIFNGLVNNGIHIQLDLSGGMDSRITFALIHASGLDLSKIAINSNKAVSNEDFEIASRISNIYKFALNHKMLNTFPMKVEDIINIFTVSKKYLHLSTQPRHFWEQLNIRLTGFSGELRRGTWQMTLKKYYKQYMWQAFGKELVNNAFNNILSAITNIVDISEDVTVETPVMEILYKNSRMRWHFGSATYSEIFLNRLLLSPLSDPVLDLVHQDDITDKNFFYAYVIERFSPELKFLNFDKDRIISSETYDLAKKINNVKKFKKDNISYKFTNLRTDPIYSYNASDDDHYYEYLRKELDDKKDLFNKHYPPCIVDHAIHAKSLYATKIEPILALCEFI